MHKKDPDYDPYLFLKITYGLLSLSVVCNLTRNQKIKNLSATIYDNTHAESIANKKVAKLEYYSCVMN